MRTARSHTPTQKTLGGEIPEKQIATRTTKKRPYSVREGIIRKYSSGYLLNNLSVLSGNVGPRDYIIRCSKRYEDMSSKKQYFQPLGTHILLFPDECQWGKYPFEDFYRLGVNLSIRNHTNYIALPGCHWMTEKIVYKDHWYYSVDEVTKQEHAIDLYSLCIFATHGNHTPKVSFSDRFRFRTDGRNMAISAIDEWCSQYPRRYLKMSILLSRSMVEGQPQPSRLRISGWATDLISGREEAVTLYCTLCRIVCTLIADVSWLLG